MSWSSLGMGYVVPVQANPPSPSPASTPRRWAALPALPVFALAAAIVVVDQATKLWAVSALSGRQPIAIVGDLLSLHLTYNPGAAFSIGSDFTWVFTVVTGAAVCVIAYTARKVRSRAWTVTMGLVLGGATTHLLDRLFRDPGVGRGHVVDFIDYAGLFVGNVADICLVVGALLWVLLSLRHPQSDTG